MYYIVKHNKNLKVWTGAGFGIKGVPIFFKTLNNAIRCVDKLIKKSIIYDTSQVQVRDRENGIIHFVENNKWCKKINWESISADIIEWNAKGFRVYLIPADRETRKIDIIIRYSSEERCIAANIDKAKKLTVEKIEAHIKELYSTYVGNRGLMRVCRNEKGIEKVK